MKLKPRMKSPPSASERLKTAATGYLNDGHFSDFTILCNGKQFKVHRCFICAHSKWFERCCKDAFKEGSTTSTELKEDNLRAVECMIHYFYTLDYDDACLVDSGPSPNNAFSSPLVLKANVYATADKYDIPDLKMLAFEKFKRVGLALISNAESILDATRAVYCDIPHSPYDDKLRAGLVNLWVLGRSDVRDGIDNESYLELMKAAPQFAADLSSKMLRVPGTDVYRECTVCHNDRTYNDDDDVTVMTKDDKCSECSGEMAKAVTVVGGCMLEDCL